MAHRKLWAAFRQWDLEARACAAAEGTMRRVLVTMCHRAAHDALRQWVCVVAELKEADRKVLRCVGRMLSCAVAAGWRRWLEVDARCVAVEATVRRTVKHLLHRSQSLAWRLWVAKTIERRVAALRVVRRRRRRRAPRAHPPGALPPLPRPREEAPLRRVEHVAPERRPRGGALAALDRAFALADRCLRRMQRGALYAGFRRWGAGARRADQGLQGVFGRLGRCAHDPLRALRRLDRFDAWRGWQTWARFTGEARATAARREKAARDVARLFSDRDARALRAGLTSWVLHQRTMVKLDGLFGRWQRSAEWGACPAAAPRSSRARPPRVAAAWRAWAEAAADRRRAEALILKTLGHLKHRAAAAAWGRWRRAARERGDEDLVAGWRRRERDHRLKVLFWDLDGKRSGALRKALLVWSGANSSHTRNLRIVARCAARLRHRGLLAALNAWVDDVAERKRLRGLVARAVKRFGRDALAPALRQWRSAARELDGARDVHDAALHVFKRLLLKDRDALLRAWVLWQAQVWVAQEAYWRAQRIVPEAQRSTRVTLSSAMAAAERTVRRMLRKRLGAGWRAWIEALGAHRALHRREETMRLVVRRMRRRELVFGVDVWARRAREAAAAAGARARALGAFVHALHLWRRRDLGAALRAWRTYLDGLSLSGRACRMVSRAFAKIAHRGAADALRRWRAFLQRLDAAEAAARRCARALRRWDMRDAGRALATWRRKAESELALEVAGRAGGVLDSPERTFGEWFGSSKRGRRSRSPSPAPVPKLHARRTLAAHFDAWVGLVADRWNVRRLAMRASEDVATRRFVQGKCTPIYFHGMPMLRVTALFEGVVEKVTHTVGPLAITQHAYLHRAPAARASPAKARAAPLEFFEPSSRAIAQFDKACRTRPVDTVADLAYERERYRQVVDRR
ncbi:hypothetical protein JL722_1606 [Aureococcus anophagefferens]|nr:hypothetical protein JL722_1606 [Aureococcus anophagefferens]